MHIHHCTEDENCPENKSKLIAEKKECVDDFYNNESSINENISYLTDNITDFVLQINITEFFDKFKISNISKADANINDLRDSIMNGSMNTLISTVIEKDKKDLLIKDANIQYQITSSENQIKNKYDDTSTIILGECEDILKDKFNIDKNMTLIILKIDYYQPGTLIPVIGYEIFHPVTKEKLDLSYCKDELINLNIPVSKIVYLNMTQIMNITQMNVILQHQTVVLIF